MGKASYLERSLKSYFVDKFLGGFKLLLQKSLLPFSIILFTTFIVNVGGMFLYYQNVSWVTEDVVKSMLLCGYLIAASIVVFGLASAVWKKYLFQVIVVYLSIIASILYIL